MATDLRAKAIDADNILIGLVICGFAAHAWITFYNGVDEIILYYSIGVWDLPSLASLSILVSAIYLTVSATILLSQSAPLARYDAVAPNFIALLAGFGVYSFIWMPGGDVLGVSSYVCLLLIIVGTSSIVVSMLYLRRAFSVTPQARLLVMDGPYRFMRHPMYFANVISLLGLTLLVDSWPALSLFVVCSFLQVMRARYEEKILEDNFEAYASYKQRVGGFVPKAPRWVKGLNKGHLLSAALIACTSNTFASPPRIGGPHLPNAASMILVSSLDPATTATLCNKWYNKALSGEWFSQAERKDLERSDLAIDKIPECKKYAELNSKCTNFLFSWNGLDDEHPINDSTFLHKIEDQNGCRYLVGLDNVCKAQESVAKRGMHLTDDELSLMHDCFDRKLRQRRIEFLRPAE